MTGTTQILAAALALVLGAAAFPAAAQTRAQPAAAAPAAAPDDAASARSVATATRFLDRFDTGDFEAARADFSAEMTAVLDAAKLSAVSTQLAQAGAPAARSAPRVMQHEGYEVVVYTIERGSALVDATISIDRDGKVAGVYFLPAQQDAAQPPAGD